jgi:hypothetical protein
MVAAFYRHDRSRAKEVGAKEKNQGNVTVEEAGLKKPLQEHELSECLKRSAWHKQWKKKTCRDPSGVHQVHDNQRKKEKDSRKNKKPYSVSRSQTSESTFKLMTPVAQALEMHVDFDVDSINISQVQDDTRYIECCCFISIIIFLLLLTLIS